MKYVVQCPCGVSIVAEDQAALVSRVQAHAAEAHGLSLTADQVLDMMSIVGRRSPSTGSGRSGS